MSIYKQKNFLQKMDYNNLSSFLNKYQVNKHPNAFSLDSNLNYLLIKKYKLVSMSVL